VLTALGLVGMLLVKGIFAVFGPLLCALWLVASRRDPERTAGAPRAWAGLALAVAAMPVTALVYEWLYRSATGEPFTCHASSASRRLRGRRAQSCRRPRTSSSISDGSCGSRSWSLALLVAGW
jgi:hypothetical protein